MRTIQRDLAIDHVTDSAMRQTDLRVPGDLTIRPPRKEQPQHQRIPHTTRITINTRHTANSPNTLSEPHTILPEHALYQRDWHQRDVR